MTMGGLVVVRAQCEQYLKDRRRRGAVEVVQYCAHATCRPRPYRPALPCTSRTGSDAPPVPAEVGQPASLWHLSWPPYATQRAQVRSVEEVPFWWPPSEALLQEYS
jgi:hypothetical protein